MNLSNRGVTEDKLPERPIVRTVAKAARNDGDQLAASPHEGQRRGDESRIKIDCFDPHLPKDHTVLRRTLYFLVRGIENRVGERSRTLQTSPCGLPNEIARVNPAR